MPVLFVCALPEESAALTTHVPVVHVGVGKVQAATALAAALHDRPADLVVNLGTAGGLRGQPIGEVIPIATVFQHDFDHREVARFVGRPVGGGPLHLQGPEGTHGVLATGDRVIADVDARTALAEHAHLVDMEGYALAATARAFGRDVWLVKAVSDGADHDAVGSWHEALTRCSEALARWAEGHGLLD
jgi:adenosylhomocysteine nucleosidase